MFLVIHNYDLNKHQNNPNQFGGCNNYAALDSERWAL